jgi:hypothetical protein
VFSISISKLSKSYNYALPGFPYNLLFDSGGDIGFLKKLRSSIDQEIRPQNASTPLGPILLGYLVPGQVWHFSADCNDGLARFFLRVSNGHYTCSLYSGLPHPTKQVKFFLK